MKDTQVQDDLQGILFHKYANYFLNVLISACNANQRIKLLESMRGFFLDACYNSFGMHPIQAFLSRKVSQEEEDIMRALVKGKIVTLSLVSFLISMNTGAL